VLPNSRGNVLSVGVKYSTRGSKICDFRLKSPFISETVGDRLICLLWNVNRKSQVADRSVPVPMTLRDLRP